MVHKVNEMLQAITWNNDHVTDFLGKYLTEPKPDVIFEPSRKISQKQFANHCQQKIVMLDLKSQMLFSQTEYYLNGEKLNIELSSEFILFISTLMRIKAKMLLPRKELDDEGNEIDPRQELINKILEYKRFKEAATKMAEMEALRMLMVKRGNLQKEISQIGEEAGEGTEIQTVTLFKLMKAFEKVILKLQERNFKPVHTVMRYNYTMEESREYMLNVCSSEKTVSFEKVFEICEDRIHAIFLFLSLLELVQMRYMSLLTGEGRNNFIVEWNENREEDIVSLLPGEEAVSLN